MLNSKRFKHAIKQLLDIGGVGRWVDVMPGDIFLTSYPKSGNTWVRFLLGNLLGQKEEVSFNNIEQIIPDIYQNTAKELTRVAQPRVLKSHEYFDPRYKSVIYLVRDPRDVAISYYYHCLKFGVVSNDTTIDDFIIRFIAGKIDRFGPWGQHVGSWIGARENDPDFVLMRYEDMLDNPQECLNNIASSMDLVVTDNIIQSAIRMSSISRMKKLESIQGAIWKSTKGTDKSMPFVRKGKSGGWREELTTRQAEMIWNEWHVWMERLGYLE